MGNYAEKLVGKKIAVIGGSSGYVLLIPPISYPFPSISPPNF